MDPMGIINEFETLRTAATHIRFVAEGCEHVVPVLECRLTNPEKGECFINGLLVTRKEYDRVAAILLGEDDVDSTPDSP